MLDNEPAVLTLTVPVTVAENAGTLINQGHLNSSAPPNKPVTVQLTSSDTNVVQVAASVVIQSNQTAASFNLTIVNNQRLDGDHTAAIITTVANWTNDSKTITVTDDETTNLRLSGPAIVNEGTGAVFSVFLTGTLTTNVSISLSSSDTNTLVTQPSIVVLAGQTPAMFTVSAPDDALFEGAKSTILSAAAPGFIGISNVITVPDNDTHHFGFSAISNPQTSAVPFVVSITGRDIDGFVAWIMERTNCLAKSYDLELRDSDLDTIGNFVRKLNQRFTVSAPSPVPRQTSKTMTPFLPGKNWELL